MKKRAMSIFIVILMMIAMIMFVSCGTTPEHVAAKSDEDFELQQLSIEGCNSLHDPEVFLLYDEEYDTEYFIISGYHYDTAVIERTKNKESE